MPRYAAGTSTALWRLPSIEFYRRHDVIDLLQAVV
jgi:hypothetical protein